VAADQIIDVQEGKGITGRRTFSRPPGQAPSASAPRD
jgi:hypothetical protein